MVGRPMINIGTTRYRSEGHSAGFGLVWPMLVAWNAPARSIEP
jgi:hypothetical protein